MNKVLRIKQCDLPLVTFQGIECCVYISTYVQSIGRTAMYLVDNLDGCPMGRVTMNIPDIELEADEVIVKNYAENEGMLEAILKVNLVQKPHRYVSNGYVDVPVCRLSPGVVNYEQVSEVSRQPDRSIHTKNGHCSASHDSPCNAQNASSTQCNEVNTKASRH